VRLVGETLWHESAQLTALGQQVYGNEVFGPGLGISSFERPTWDWLYPIYHAIATKLGHNREIAYDELAWNLALNVIACRLRYYVDKRKLPELAAGIPARTAYWFFVYNGSGVAERHNNYMRDAAQIQWIGGQDNS
jgi:hypothetical protein